MRVLVALLLLPAITSDALAQSSSGASRAAPEIVANGSGEVKLKPDRAVLTIAVVTRAGSAAEAGRENVKRIQPLLAALRRQRLADTAIVTTGYTVSLDRDPLFGQPAATASRPPTYSARNAVRVSITDLDALGQLLDTALAAGATEIAGVSFASSQASQARQRAIALAVSESRASAEAAATAAGGSLGPLIEVSLQADYPSAYFEMARAAGAVAGGGTPYMPNDVGVRVQARVRYAYTPGPGTGNR